MDTLISHGQYLTFCNKVMGSHVVQMVVVDCLLVGSGSQRRERVLLEIVAALKAVEEYRF